MQYSKYSAAGGTPREPSPSVDPKRLRRRMVREQLEARGISDPAVLGAMLARGADAYAAYAAPVTQSEAVVVDDADEGEERFSLRTRSMAEVLAEQGDIKGALDIYHVVFGN